MYLRVKPVIKNSLQLLKNKSFANTNNIFIYKNIRILYKYGGWKYQSATQWLYTGGVEGQWINIRVTMYYASLFHRIFSLSAHVTRKIISGELLSSLGLCKLSTFESSSLKLLNQAKPNFAASPWDEDIPICSSECDPSQGGAIKGPSMVN